MSFTPDELDQLYLLVGQAWELRDTGYVFDAAEAIVAWHERRRLARLEAKEEEMARLVQVLRETNPRREGA